MKKNILLLLGFLSLWACEKPVGQFHYVTSNGNGYWQETDLPVMKKSHMGIKTLIVNTKMVEQEIDGFGACFNELGWDALQLLKEEERNNIIKDFFSPEGFNFSICRVPIGANDYARNWYSLNEIPGDFAMENFSIERDMEILIPYIKMAIMHKPDLKVWGSPWCPPEWMKENKHYACRPDEVNDLTPEGAGREGQTQFIMEEDYLRAYALYFLKFIQEYRSQGIDLYAVHVQNEPNSCQNFPSCVWTAADQAVFIGNYLGPLFEEAEMDAEIWYGTYERPFPEKVDTLLNLNSGKYIDGIGFQWAGKKAIPEIHAKYPAMRLMQTESECGDGSNNQASAEYTWSLIKHYFENGANSYMYWNMILDETGKSQWGWKQNSLISVDSKSGEYQKNPEYYLFRHLSHFVKPGARKLSTPRGGENMLLFLNPDSQVVGLIVNDSNRASSVQLKIGEDFLIVQLLPHSFNTVTYQLKN